MPDAPGSKGCSLIVAAYADVADAVARVTANAAARIVTSPMLGDFVDVRFVGIAPRPRSPDESAAAVAQLADELTRPSAGTAETYFALAFVDRSAATIEDLFGDCVRHPVIVALPLRCRGLAIVDDRASDGTAVGDPAAVMVFPRARSWTASALAAELIRYAEDLLGDFASTYEHGLTRAEVSAVRAAHGLEPIDQPHEDGAGDAELDLMPPDEMPPGLWPDAGPGEEPAPQHAPLADRPAAARTALPWADSAPGPARPYPGSRPRRLPVRRPRATAPVGRARVRSASPGTQMGAVAPAASSSPVVLAYFVPVGGILADHSAWRRARSAILDLDRALSAIPEVACYVRVLGTVKSEPQEAPRRAGLLTAREVRRPAQGIDLPRLLSVVRVTLSADRRASARLAVPLLRPLLLFVAMDVPLADAVTVKKYQELAVGTAVAWVVPDATASLLSPDLATEGARVLTDHPGVADEVVSLLRAGWAGSFRRGSLPGAGELAGEPG